MFIRNIQKKQFRKHLHLELKKTLNFTIQIETKTNVKKIEISMKNYQLK